MKKIYQLITAITFLSFNSWGQSNRIWATYYGGTGNEPNYTSVATDASGNVYICALTTSTAGISSGGHQNTHGGGLNDAMLIKFDAAGNRLWATYYGDIGSEYAFGVTTDISGNVYLCGQTGSANNIASGGHQNTLAGTNDAYLVKFNSSGVRQWATYYGGTGTNDVGYDVATDALGNVYMAGNTNSSGSIASGGHQNTLGGGDDAFLVKFNSSGVRQWATYYGGTANEDGFGVAVDASTGDVYLSGGTPSPASIASGGFQNVIGGGTDAFLVKFNSSGVRQWATYYGGTSGDFSEQNGLCVDPTGNIFLSGQTSSTASIASGGFQNTLGGGIVDAFLVKFNTSGARIWATYYGALGNEQSSSTTTDQNGNVFLGGRTTSSSGIPFNGFQSTYGGAEDGYLVKFGPSGNLLSASYYGDLTMDRVLNVACDNNNNVYAAGMTTSSANIASGGFQNVFGGGSNDAFLVKFASCTGAPTQPVSISGNSIICSGSSNTYSFAAVNGATSYSWSLPGGWSGTSSTNTISTTASATSGNVSVTSINACGNSVVQTLSVTVNTIPATPGAISGNITICSGSSNTYSVAAVAGATAYTWVKPGGWTGASSTNIINTTASAVSGNITVSASNMCGTSAVQTLSITVNTAPGTPGAISGLISLCTGAGASNYSVASVAGATSYTWSLAGGWSGVSSTNIISATPGSSGIFTVTASNTCGMSAQQTLSVTVNPLPTITVNSGSICSGNSFTMVPGGASTYTFQGGNAVVSPTTNTSYTVTGTSTAGCVSSSPATSNVTVSTTPTVNVAGGAICPGSSFTLNPSGANTYTYSNGQIVSPTVTTTYSVSGTSTAGCGSQMAVVTITVANNLTVTISGNNTVCAGSPINLTAGGAASYTWNTGATTTTITPTPTASTTYSVLGTSGSCSNTAQVSVTVNPLPTLSLTTSNAAGICLGQTATLTVSGANTYSWSTGAITNTIAVSPTVTTAYTVTGTNANGCSTTSVLTQIAVDCTDINELSGNASSFNVYPNPFNNKITVIAVGAKPSVLQVYNTLGSLIYSSEIKEKIEIDLTKENSGIYFIRIGTITKKIIKE